MITKQIKEILKKEGFLSKKTFSELKDYEKLNMGNILDFCIDRGIAPVEKIISLLRKSYMMPVVDLNQVDIDFETSKLLPSSVCFEHAIIPFYQDESSLYVAMSNPDNQELVDFITQKTGKKAIAYITYQNAIKQALESTFNNSAEDNHKNILELIERAQNLTHTPEVMAQQVPIISLVNQLIIYALKSKASDMHIEPREEKVLIRLRVDGMLHELFILPKEMLDAIVARIKILSRLRIDEHMRPQDGRFTFSENGFRIAIRVSIIPTLYGQKVALRFLDTENDDLSLNSLGLNAEHLQQLKKAIGFSSGMILVTGPTGSGKTTTLYSLLKEIEKEKVNISTIEDPIEYHLQRANQTQVNSQVNLTFAEGLRSILRQDPDIIMVGEIRDRETAKIAVNAALTGHLVLSSLHTNSAAAAIPRLLDMGVEPFLVASTLRAVIGQRLVRSICPSCKTEFTVDNLPESLAVYYRGPKPLKISKGDGCKDCLQTGYHGRSGIFEVLMIDEHLHDLIINRAHSSTIEKIAKEYGMKTLAEDGVNKILNKSTTIEEIVRIIN